MFKQALGLVLISLFVLGCSGKRYGHYGYTKKKTTTNVEKRKLKPKEHQKLLALKKVEILPKTIPTEITLKPKVVNNKPTNSSALHNTSVVRNIYGDVEADLIKSDSIAEPRVNTYSKIAFWSAIGTLGAGVAALAFGEFFFLLIPVLALVALIFGVIALRQIKRTGEYGRPKAEFALFVAIPFLLATILYSIIFWSIVKGVFPLVGFGGPTF